FFFQAEDGIRDGHVTGVQTCALPICLWVQTSARAFGMPATRYGASPKFGGSANNHASAGHHPAAELSDSAAVSLRFVIAANRARSEERRVGKECRSRGSTDDVKRKRR